MHDLTPSTPTIPVEARYLEARYADETPPPGGALGLSLLALLCVGATGGVPTGFGYVCWWALRYGLDFTGLAGLLIAFSMASTFLSAAIPFAFGLLLYIEITGAYRASPQTERGTGRPRAPSMAGVFA